MHSLNITASSPVNSAVVNFACCILDPNYGKGRLENTFFWFFFPLLFRSTCNLAASWRFHSFGDCAHIGQKAQLWEPTIYSESVRGSHDRTSWILTNNVTFFSYKHSWRREVIFYLQEDQTRLFVQDDTGHMWRGAGPKLSSSSNRRQTLWNPVPICPKGHGPIATFLIDLFSFLFLEGNKLERGRKKEKKRFTL